MNTIQITNAGKALMAQATEPLVLTSYKLGTGTGYVPSATQTDIQGTLVHTGTPAAPVIEDSNTMLYSVFLSGSSGPFAFGEIGLFYQSTLFAILVFDLLQNKQPINLNDSSSGGPMVIDCFVPMVGSNYQMWANVTQANVNKASVVTGPEQLPYSVNTVPNLYVVAEGQGAKAYLAYTDRRGIWNFDSWAPLLTLQVVSATMTAITVATADLGNFTFGGTGSTILQMTNGVAAAACRYPISALPSGQNTVLSLNAPIARVPQTGDQLKLYTVAAGGGGGGGSDINLSAPPPIGNVTPSSGAFTTLSFTGPIASETDFGTAGQVLTSQGPMSRPLWTDVASGGGGGGPAPTGNPYLFATFEYSQRQLSICASTDGGEFQWIRRNVYQPSDGSYLSNPSLAYVDGLWTVAFTKENPNLVDSNGFLISQKIGLITSPDLIHWTEKSDVFPAISGLKRAWSPQWILNTDATPYLFFAGSTSTQDNVQGFNLYHMHALDAGLNLWSTATLVSGSFPGSVIDPFPITLGGQWFLFFKNQDSGMLAYSAATSLTGTYTVAQDGTVDFFGLGPQVEGPCVTRNGQGYRVYVEHYPSKGLIYVDTADFNSYTPPARMITPPPHTSALGHGRVIQVSDPTQYNLALNSKFEEIASPELAQQTFGLTELPHGVVLTKKGRVIQSGGLGSWNENRVDYPNVFWDPLIGQYRMVYGGTSGAQGSPSFGALGYSTSPDLLNWTAYGSNPFFSKNGTSGQPDSGGVSRPFVWVENGIYYLFYVGSTTNDNQTIDTLCLATSTDFVTWTRVGTVIGLGISGWRQTAIGRPSVVKKGNVYYLFFSATGATVSQQQIGVAKSKDLVHWLPDDANSPVLALPGSGWDVTQVRDPFVYKIGDVWYMSYTGNSGSGSQLGLAWTSDHLFPTGWTRLGSAPILPRGANGSVDALDAARACLLMTPSRAYSWYTTSDGASPPTIGINLSTDDTLVPNPSPIQVNSQSVSAYTVTGTDAPNKSGNQGLILMTATGPNTVRIDKQVVTGLPVGTQLYVIQGGVGQTTVAPIDGSVQIKTAGTLVARAQNSKLTLIQTAADVWYLSGDTT